MAVKRGVYRANRSRIPWSAWLGRDMDTRLLATAAALFESASPLGVLALAAVICVLPTEPAAEWAS